MSTIAAILQIALSLLLAVQNNPTLPDAQKKVAIETAVQAIQLATQASVSNDRTFVGINNFGNNSIGTGVDSKPVSIVPTNCHFFVAPSCAEGEKLVFTPGTCYYNCVSVNIACTQEAKICPDGKTTVARDANDNCQFSACPATTSCPTPSFVCPDGSNPTPKTGSDYGLCDYVCLSKPPVACPANMPYCPNGYNTTTNSDGCPIYTCKTSDTIPCTPRPACMDTAAGTQCNPPQPIGGWCTDGIRVCPMLATPYCPNGYNSTQNSNGCPIYTCKDPVSCASRPACLDSEPACKLPEPAGGWCPLETKPKPICLYRLTPDCPNGYVTSVDSNGCQITTCKSPAVCEHPAPPSGCRYVDGPDIAANPCNQVLSCILEEPICPMMLTPYCPNGYITTINSNGCQISSCR